MSEDDIMFDDDELEDVAVDPLVGASDSDDDSDEEDE